MYVNSVSMGQMAFLKLNKETIINIIVILVVTYAWVMRPVAGTERSQRCCFSVVDPQAVSLHNGRNWLAGYTNWTGEGVRNRPSHRLTSTLLRAQEIISHRIRYIHHNTNQSFHEKVAFEGHLQSSVKREVPSNKRVNELSGKSTL